MWGWLNSVVDGLASIWQSITDIPGKIADKLSNFFSDLKDAILGLPNLILEGIKSIFVPDQEVIKLQFENLLEELSHKFNLHIDSLQSFADSLTEQAVSNETSEYTLPGVGTFNLVFLDTTFFIRGVEYFRPLIRGFIVLLLCFYNIRQFFSFIGQEIGIAGHIIEKGAKEE